MTRISSRASTGKCPGDVARVPGQDNPKGKVVVEDSTQTEIRSDGYFAIIPEWILDAEFSPSAIMVYLTLARYSNRQTRTCFPSKETIQQKSRLSPNTVSKALAELKEGGAISSKRRNRNGQPTSNVYVLHMLGPFGRVADDEALIPKIGEALIPNSEALIPKIGIRTRQVNQKSKDISLSPTANSKFDEFWDAYPRRIAKGSARKAWSKATNHNDPDKIIEAAKRYAQTRRGEDPRFTPHPASWLNAERWLDQPETLVAKDKRQQENILVAEAMERLMRQQLEASNDER